MLIKKSDQFIFEGMSCVMFLLRLNIPYCVVNARNGNAESSIPFLPLKQTLVSKGSMNPL